MARGLRRQESAAHSLPALLPAPAWSGSCCPLLLPRRSAAGCPGSPALAPGCAILPQDPGCRICPPTTALVLNLPLLGAHSVQSLQLLLGPELQGLSPPPPGAVTSPGSCMGVSLAGVTDGCWALPRLVVSIVPGEAEGNSAPSARARSPSWKSRGRSRMCLWQQSPPGPGQGPPPPTAGLDQTGATMSLHQPQPLHPHEPGALLCPPTTIAAVPCGPDHLGMCGLERDGVSPLANICPDVPGHGV